jgi:hypothetical protein
MTNKKAKARLAAKALAPQKSHGKSQSIGTAKATAKSNG